MPHAEAASQRAACILSKLLEDHASAVSAAQSDVDTAAAESAEAHKRVASLKKASEIEDTPVQTRRRGLVRRSRHSNPDIRREEEERKQQRLAELSDALTIALVTEAEASAREATCRAKLCEAATAYSQRRAQLGPVTPAEFMETARDLAKNAFSFYSNLILKEPQLEREGGVKYKYGECAELRRALKAVAILFDPEKTAGIPRADKIQAIRHLSHFKLPLFESRICQGLEQEIDYVQELARSPFNWTTVPGAESFRKRNKNKQWRQVAGEKGRRVWEWWRTHRHNERIPTFLFVVRILAVIAVSSADIERAFSVYGNIVAKVGEALEDVFEARLFCLLNGEDFFDDTAYHIDSICLPP